MRAEFKYIYHDSGHTKGNRGSSKTFGASQDENCDPNSEQSAEGKEPIDFSKRHVAMRVSYGPLPGL